METCKIYGDFFGKAEIEDVETVLVGVALKKQALLEALNSIDLAPYFGPVVAEDLVAILVK
ncbi:lipoate protein ligase C-terminal domain-containing protein [Aerococcus agrisoli]|uniref:lipoate protein ligase C-terminal domain-containing protein n=1 Tax=Aerococcus agrisoli TaxID=2487350 RepID=UPI0013157152|nr:lipoate protein ligase C-terminal domain-containing protein [Aerococcus agrisoli]